MQRKSEESLGFSYTVSPRAWTGLLQHVLRRLHPVSLMLAASPSSCAQAFMQGCGSKAGAVSRSYRQAQGGSAPFGSSASLCLSGIRGSDSVKYRVSPYVSLLWLGARENNELS